MAAAELSAEGVRPRRDNPRAAHEIERGLDERRRLEQLDREAPLAHRELCGGDVDGASLLQAHDAIDASRRKMA